MKRDREKGRWLKARESKSDVLGRDLVPFKDRKGGLL